MSSSVRIYVYSYLIVGIGRRFFPDIRWAGVQYMAASPYVAALVHYICGRFSDYMGYCRSVEMKETGAQPRFNQAGSGYAAKRYMLFHALR